MSGPAALIALLVLLAPAALRAQGPVASLATRDDSMAAVLRTALGAGERPTGVAALSARQREQVTRVYEAAVWRPLWIAGGRPTPLARDIVAVLREADTRGLDPDDYDVAGLEREIERLARVPSPSAAELARLDAALSASLLRHLWHVHGGRVDPASLGFALGVGTERHDLGQLFARVAAGEDVRRVLAEAEPRFAPYGNTLRALAAYRRLAAIPLDALPPLAGALKPGETWRGVPALRRRLHVLGDLRDTLATPVDTATGSADSLRYAGAVVDAVRRFQERHGLEADGVIGPATLRALRVPLARRARQLELALERMRWVPDLEPGPVVVVNIPGFQLFAFDSATGGPTLESRVIVGQALETRTPIFVERMRYLSFRPYWNVPRSIVRNEILPAIARDPSYLRRNQMELVRHFGDDVPGLEPTPARIELLRRGLLEVRQRPGPWNALGAVKFIFPNNANVYLHSTPDTSLFARARRDFSHGCIRVQRAEELANWVLRGHPEFPPARVRELMTTPGPPVRADLERAIPVLIFYVTAVARADGRVQFFEDVYGHDARLERLLR